MPGHYRTQILSKQERKSDMQNVVRKHIAFNGLPLWRAARKREFRALADLSQQAMKDFDEHFAEYSDYKPEHFTDAREMLDKSKPDVVSVGVWDKGHAPMTMAAAASGAKAVLCEKPMADTVGAAADMLMVCRRNGVKLAVGHQRRFLPAYTLAKQMIADGEIGDVRLITAFARDGLPNYSSHQTDMFRYLLNDAECAWVMGSVERETDRWARAIPIVEQISDTSQRKRRGELGR